MKESPNVPRVDRNGSEASRVLEALHARGFTDDDIKRIAEREETPQKAFQRLEAISRGVGFLLDPLPPPRELEVYEESLLAEMLSGRLGHYENGRRV